MKNVNNYVFFFSLQMTYPRRVQGLQEVGIGSSLTDDHIMETMQS